jgi:5-methylcytosine-specific restriction endonuclease McrA
MTKLAILRPRLTVLNTQRTATLPPPSKAATYRIRGRTLQRIRDAHLRERPLCVMCSAEGKVSAGQELDHKIPLHLGGVESPDPFENRQNLCRAHHLEKTAGELKAK